MNITPYWKDYHRKLNYTAEQFRDPEQVEQWKAVGHNLSNMTIDLCQDAHDSWLVDPIEDYFTNLKHIGIAFHCLRPGHYLPMHSDKYGFYAKKYNVTDLNLIKRYIIFLEDSAPGHMLVINNKAYTEWKAGDIKHWQGTEPHSAINLGIVNRYTLQVTGIERGK